MNAIEPHWISLLLFAALATVCTLSFLVVAGMFPLHSRPETLKSNGGLLLVTGNALLLAALSIGTAYFGFSELRWTTLVVAAGLVVLFAPGLFEIWPASVRDGSKGLIVLMGVQLLALATLTKLASSAWVDNS